jgi:hypothetical protein
MIQTILPVKIMLDIVSIVAIGFHNHNQVHKEDCPVQIAKELRAMEYKQ